MASGMVLDAETLRLEIKFALILPKLAAVNQVITLSISPMIPMVNVLEAVALSCLSPNLVAVMVKL
jgi:hypothetical protein